MLSPRKLKAFCKRYARKIALTIYGARMVTISPVGVKRFAARLFSSAKDAGTEDEINDALQKTQREILGEYRNHSLRMWSFCGRCVIRLYVELAIQYPWVEFDSPNRLNVQRRLFRVLRKATDDADVNTQRDLFLTAVRIGYSTAASELTPPVVAAMA